MPVLQVPAGEEGGPGGYPNHLKGMVHMNTMLVPIDVIVD